MVNISHDAAEPAPGSSLDLVDRERIATGRLGGRLGYVGLAVVLHLALAVSLSVFSEEFITVVLGDLAPTIDLRSTEETILGLLFVILPLPWLPRRIEYPSQIFGYILYLTVYLSFCTIGLQSIALPIQELIPFMTVCALCCIALFRMASYPARPIQRAGVSTGLVAMSCVAAAAVVIVWAVATIGVDFRPLAIDEVYELRAFRRIQFATEGYWYWGYMLNPLSQVLAPLVVCAALSTRRYMLLPLALLMAYASYQTSSDKSALGGTIICVVAYFAWGTREGGSFAFSPIRIVASMLVLLFGTMVYEYWVDDPSLLASQLTIGRVFTIPGMISAYWVEFFSSNPLGYFTGSGFLGLFFGREQPYVIPLSYVIGLQYFQDEATNANVNVWADAFGNLGVVGTFLASIVTIGIMRFLDKLTADREMSLILPLCLPLAFTLTNGSITSIILTNGLWLMVIVMYFLPPRQERPS